MTFFAVTNFLLQEHQNLGIH